MAGLRKVLLAMRTEYLTKGGAVAPFCLYKYMWANCNVWSPHVFGITFYTELIWEGFGGPCICMGVFFANTLRESFFSLCRSSGMRRPKGVMGYLIFCVLWPEREGLFFVPMLHFSFSQ